MTPDASLPPADVEKVKCRRCGGTNWHRERGPDCMYAVCGRCDIGYDIGWTFPNPRYFDE